MAKVLVENSSGIIIPVTPNPYDGLIDVCNDESKSIQALYQSHRTARNSLQKDRILADDFSGWVLDEHLVKLDGVQKDSTYVDPRHCLTAWARPPRKIKNLIDIIQAKLKDTAPDLWLMPLENLHMTTMEVTHSRTKEEIEHLASILTPNSQACGDLTRTHRARLIKPMIGYDAAALALTFVTAAGESPPKDRKASDDDYTYHHLRRDVFKQITDSGVDVSSRYVVPTAHLTIARFNSPNVFGGDVLDGEMGKELKTRQHWIREIETINKWLEAEYWPKPGNDHIKAGGEWIVGEEKGLDMRKGQVWYGGGETIYIGKGF